MDRRRCSIGIIGCALALIASTCSNSATSPEQQPAPIVTITPAVRVAAMEASPIGNVSREIDVVEHGHELSTLAKLIAPTGLFAGDIVQVHEGGEGLLDFGDQMRLRLFNDSRLAVLQTASAPDAPLDVRLFLEEGGFTGELAKAGNRALFQTPGGAEITILGTQFAVIYDAAAKMTTVINFGGTIEVAGGSRRISLSSGYYLTVPDGQPPGAQMSLAMSFVEFEQRARELRSPIGAAKELTRWSVTITHKWTYTGGRWNVITWSGQFTVVGERITGNGLGKTTGHHQCGITIEPDYDVEGEFVFQITGKPIAQSDGRTIFRLAIEGKDLKLRSGAKCRGNFYENAIAARLRTLAEQLSSLVEDIEIEARDGSKTTIKLPDSLAVFSAAPLEVELKLAAGE